MTGAGVAVGVGGGGEVEVGTTVAQTVTSDLLVEAVVRVLGFALLAAVSAASAAFAFRWYSTDEIPEGVAVLLGIAPVAIWLNTQSALQDAILGQSDLLDAETAIYTIIAFAASAIAADAGRRIGDYFAREVFTLSAPRTISEVGQLLWSAGRVVSVELPKEIEDVEGYDPVDEATKEALSGQTFLLPRRLSADQLRERLIDRLERDYGIGQVDIELTPEKTISYLAVGGRQAGIGPTLAPGSIAVAIQADPAPDASPGDAVRIWVHEDAGDGDASDASAGVRRLTEGELRATAGDVATVAIDDNAASMLAGDDARYRLVTRPDIPGKGREFVSVVRAADETVTTLAVEDGGSLEGESVGSLPVLVLAIERDSGARTGAGTNTKAEAEAGTEATTGDEPEVGTKSGDETEAGTGAEPDDENEDADPTARQRELEASDGAVALPAADVRLEAGDVVYVLGRPDALRRLATNEREAVRERTEARRAERKRERAQRREEKRRQRKNRNRTGSQN